jgi:putative peptide zinc metalloprotease protein
MTGPSTRPIPVVGSSSGAPTTAGPGGEVLQRAEGLELLGEVPGSGYRQAPALARRGDGQVITLTPLLHQAMVAIDGRRDLADVAAVVSEASGRLVRPEDVQHLVEATLRPLGLLRLADGSEPELRRANPLLALRARKVVTDPAITRRLTTPFAVLFAPFVAIPVVLAFLAISGWVLFREGLAAATAQAFQFPSLFLLVIVVTVLSAGFHEFGHAAAAQRGGATPGAMGFGFYLFWPAFYTDVTDSYRLGRGGRLRTDLGGLYFNAIIVLLTFGVWWLTGWHALLLIVVTQVLQMIRQLAPMLRFDGYHVLADVTGVPDLYQRIGPILKGLLPGHWRPPEAVALKTWARVVVTVWVLAVVPLMLLSMLLVVLSLPRLVATAWVSVGAQSAELSRNFADGDVLGVLARGLAIVVLVVPLLGIGYVVVRLVRRVVAGTLRRTEGRPVRRALAALVAAALVTGLAWAWWPSTDRYQPVRAWEGGTVLDAVPAASGSSLGAGSRGAATTLWPADAGPLPTPDHPVLAMVMTPRADSGSTPAPTWVFPFDRPLPPGTGDNQALAVNTTDGSVTYDVSFSLVWADGSTALNKNEAYAFASCTDCRTVAVAFQVVLLAGQVDVVVPQNLSGAVNYACVRCVTQALATQLVVSVPDALTDAQNAQLDAVWKQLQAFGAHIQDVPLAELQSRLDQFTHQILAIVAPDAGNGATPTTSGATSSGAATSAAATSSSAGDGAARTAQGSSTGPSSTGAAATGGTTTSGASATTEAPPTSAGPTSAAAEPTATATASG